MNPVGEVVQADDIRLDLDVRDETAVLHAVAELLARRLGLSPTDVFASLAAREALGSTGLGHGVAIPHARLSRGTATAGAFVRTRVGIPFDAPDRKPVTLFLALVVQKGAIEQHLNLLAAAAAMFDDPTFRAALQTSPTAAEVRALLAQGSAP